MSENIFSTSYINKGDAFVDLCFHSQHFKPFFVLSQHDPQDSKKYIINKQIIEGQIECDCFKDHCIQTNSHRIMLIGYRLVGKIKSYLDIWGPHGKISSCEEECRQIFPCDKPVGTLLCNLNLPRKRDGKNTIYLFISTNVSNIPRHESKTTDGNMYPNFEYWVK